jgi:hypothetical protein
MNFKYLWSLKNKRPTVGKEKKNQSTIEDELHSAGVLNDVSGNPEFIKVQKQISRVKTLSDLQNLCNIFADLFSRRVRNIFPPTCWFEISKCSFYKVSLLSDDFGSLFPSKLRYLTTCVVNYFCTSDFFVDQPDNNFRENLR